MGIIQKIIEKIKGKKEVASNYEHEQRVMEEYANKKKSANERELERYYEEHRQAKIKKAVEGIRKKRNGAYWSGRFHNPAYTPNVVSGQKSCFNHRATLLKTQHLFTGGKKK